MSSVTTGARLGGQGLAIPLSWAAAAFVLELLAMLSSGFIAYGKLDATASNPPALTQHVRDSDGHFARVDREMGEVRTGLDATGKQLDRVEGKLDRLIELQRR